ncbi:hypothetical protein Tco_0389170 [Tanacetum coccineum]
MSWLRRCAELREAARSDQRGQAKCTCSRSKVVKAIKDKDGLVRWGIGAKQLVKPNKNGVNMRVSKGAGNVGTVEDLNEEVPDPGISDIDSIEDEDLTTVFADV